MYPQEIKVKEKKILYIKWDDNTETSIRLTNLKRACPCALCNAERETQGPNYIPLYNDDEVTLINIKLVGQYALNFSWKDGHNTGIYEFDRLKSLGQKNHN